jgi:hypothetical protein
MQTIVDVRKPGHFVFGLRDRTTPGGTTAVGSYVYEGDIRERFASSRDQDLIRTGAVAVTYGEPAAQPVVVQAAPSKPPVQEDDEAVVIEDADTPAEIQLPKAKPKGK